MPDWRDLSTMNQSGTNPLSAPRNLVSQYRAGNPVLRTGSEALPIGQPTWVGVQTGYTGQTSSIPTISDGRSQPMASYGLALQIGRAGLAALQSLGAAGAAAIAAILQSYRNRLCRLPTPAELDVALQQQAGQTDSSQLPGSAQPNDLERRRRPNHEDECQRLFDKETAVCSQVTETLGKRAGAICHQSAMTRYAECLRDGVSGVRTPLTIVTY